MEERCQEEITVGARSRRAQRDYGVQSKSREHWV